MSQILTLLGQPRTQCAIASVAMARKLAQQGARVLWLTQDGGPLCQLLWGQAITADVQSLETNLWAMQLQSTALLEKSWEIVKGIEAQYLKDPLLKQVFGQELAVIPGMDDALALNAIRELYDSGDYDYLVFDGQSSLSTIRMWGLPESLDWYIRRFQMVLQESELARTLSPFIQPVANTILNVGGGQDILGQPLQQARSLLDSGRSAVQSRHQTLGFLVTADDPVDVATARYLWGSSQQIGLTVGGVLTFGGTNAAYDQEFAPLPISPMPSLAGQNWQPLVDAAPALEAAIAQAPAPVVIDEVGKQVRLFLPGFAKSEIALTQYGPEVTITAGDQRRNLFLPKALKGLAVQGAKFQDNHLILSF